MRRNLAENNRNLVEGNKLTHVGVNTARFLSLRLSQARAGNSEWVYAAIPFSLALNDLRWRTRGEG
jgi:hypothetical protein